MEPPISKRVVTPNAKQPVTKKLKVEIASPVKAKPIESTQKEQSIHIAQQLSTSNRKNQEGFEGFQNFFEISRPQKNMTHSQTYMDRPIPDKSRNVPTNTTLLQNNNENTSNNIRLDPSLTSSTPISTVWYVFDLFFQNSS